MSRDFFINCVPQFAIRKNHESVAQRLQQQHNSIQTQHHITMSDPEAASNESSPLLPSDDSATATHSRDSSINSATLDLKQELEQPWPATFDRGIQILAGPVMDEKSIDGFTRSPSVRARYLKKVR
jgi:hypothetical protein